MIEIIGAFLAGIGAHAVYKWQVERAAWSHYMREKGARGNVKQEQISKRMNEAIMRAIELKTEGKDLKEILTIVATEFPDVALQLGGKLLSGKIKGLEGLI